MSLREYPELEQGSEEWLAQRRGMVTASVVGRLITTSQRKAVDYYCTHCGAGVGAPCVSMLKGAGAGRPIKTVHEPRTAAAQLDPSPSPLVVAGTDESRGLTALLVAERITGWSDPVYVSDDMMRGTLDEPIARDIYAQHCTIQPVRTTGFMVRSEPTWTLGYSPDGLVGDDGLIEIKSRRSKAQLLTVLADEVPAANMAQIQAGLLVTGRSWLDYVSYASGMHLYVKRIYPEQRWFDAIIAAVEQFEQTAAGMVAAYNQAVEGRPMTERIVEAEMTL